MSFDFKLLANHNILALIVILLLFVVIWHRSYFFLIPAWFFPHRRIRTLCHRLRGVKIGKNVEIGYLVQIDNSYPNKVIINDNATIVFGSMILAHDNSKKYTRSGSEIVKTVTIHERSFIGAGSIILPGITIGKRSIVGAGSVVTKNVKNDEIVVGNPAQPIGKSSTDKKV